MRAIAILPAALLIASCVERKEAIVVAPDGTITATVVHRSDDPSDLLEGDAVPDAADGWEVDLSEQVDENGKLVHVYSARRSFLPGMAAPSFYGPPQDPLAAQSLQFPTTLTVERRRGATVYHLRRVYLPRRWAELADLAESAPAKRLQQIDGIDGPDVPEATLDELARALVDVQAARTLLFARRAFVQAAPRAAQDGWLRTREAMERLSREIDARAVVEQFSLANRTSDEARKAAMVQKALRRVESMVDDRLQLAVREEAGLGASELAAFVRQLERERREAAVTEDIADDQFEITVTMPGELLASNGALVGGGATTVQWTFKGNRLFDRPIELLVSSQVAD